MILVFTTLFQSTTGKNSEIFTQQTAKWRSSRWDSHIKNTLLSVWALVNYSQTLGKTPGKWKLTINRTPSEAPSIFSATGRHNFCLSRHIFGLGVQQLVGPGESMVPVVNQWIGGWIGGKILGEHMWKPARLNCHFIMVHHISVVFFLEYQFLVRQSSVSKLRKCYEQSCRHLAESHRISVNPRDKEVLR